MFFFKLDVRLKSTITSALSYANRKIVVRYFANWAPGLCHSDFFISQLIDRADRKLFQLIQLSHHCLTTPFFPVLAFPTPGIPLDPERTSVKEACTVYLCVPCVFSGVPVWSSIGHSDAPGDSTDVDCTVESEDVASIELMLRS